MNTQRADGGAGTSSLTTFLERIRKSFSHDLRTPLGAIVNYAAVLEAHPGEDGAEVRDLGRRIRGNALRMSRMIQMLATATGLAARPLAATTTDLPALARSILVDAGGRGVVSVTSANTDALTIVDAEVVGFAWRAYVSVERDARGRAPDALALSVGHDVGALSMELSCSGVDGSLTRLAAESGSAELSGFLRYDNGPERNECAFALTLARDLILSHGGDVTVRGRPGAASALCVRLPSTA